MPADQSLAVVPSAAAAPRTIYLKDYAPPAFLVEQVNLDIGLFEDHARIENRMILRRHGEGAVPLVLDGEAMVLERVVLNGTVLSAADYVLTDKGLTLPACDGTVELEIVTITRPQDNTRLEGLYRSSGNFCTQCEAEGFRRITFYPDRPDVMASFTTRIEADKARYPVLLGNGNPVETGDAGPGRHFAIWDDPFPKPCYLFALVAGKLIELRDSFTTMSGREVRLGIYVEPGNEDKTAHAMDSLKRSMRWDEEAYGREYDLDVFNIVAVGDFNMGAMENKGLNIFNTKYVMAHPETATDADYDGVERVIAHEYFHNWSGNRVTCRDWFQLTLKEGFTVFRDQQFSADQGDPAVQRIHEVQALRAAQFPEDAGPLAHPIQPDSYIEINNFYTATVYEKGAEVIRMLHTLVGAEAFRRGSDLYFTRHDGQAATCEDFVAAIAEGSDRDLGQFQRWYKQAGTPVITAEGHYDAAARSYHLTLSQQLSGPPGLPLTVPVRLGLVSAGGHDLPLCLAGEPQDAAGRGETTRVVELTGERASFVFEDVGEPVIPSLFRGFSAPVRLEQALDDRELVLLGGHDSDSFNRWEAGQTLASRVMLRLLAKGSDQADILNQPDPLLLELYRANLEATGLEPRLRAQLLHLPSESYIAQQVEDVDPARIHAVRQGLRLALAARFREHWQRLYRQLAEDARPDATGAQIGRRSLRNTALAYLCACPDSHDEADAQAAVGLASRQYADADTMTDRLAALELLVALEGAAAYKALDDFHHRWRDDPLVLDKWFAVQARSSHPRTPERVRALMDRPDFTLRNPNRLRALIGSFTAGNPQYFHAADGSGYRLLIDVVTALDPLNPQTAARLLAPLRQWRRYEPGRRALMRAALQRLLAMADLSPDVFEVASKSLEG